MSQSKNPHQRYQASTGQARATHPVNSVNETAKFADQGYAQQTRSHYSESPARIATAARNEARVAVHQNCEYGPSHVTHSTFTNDREVDAREQRASAGAGPVPASGLRQNHQNSTAQGPQDEAHNPYLNLGRRSHELYHNQHQPGHKQAPDACAQHFDAYQVNQRGVVADLDDSLRQASQASMPGRAKSSAKLVRYRPRRRQSQSRSKSPADVKIKPDHNQQCNQINQRNSSEKKAQLVSTSSTVLYDLQSGSLRTSTNVFESSGKSPVQLRQGLVGPYAHQAYADRAREHRSSPKQLVTDNQPGEGSFSKASLTAQSEGKGDSHLRPQRP